MGRLYSQYFHTEKYPEDPRPPGFVRQIRDATDIPGHLSSRFGRRVCKNPPENSGGWSLRNRDPSASVEHPPGGGREERAEQFHEQSPLRSAIQEDRRSPRNNPQKFPCHPDFLPERTVGVQRGGGEKSFPPRIQGGQFPHSVHGLVGIQGT